MRRTEGIRGLEEMADRAESDGDSERASALRQRADYHRRRKILGFSEAREIERSMRDLGGSRLI